MIFVCVCVCVSAKTKLVLNLFVIIKQSNWGLFLDDHPLPLSSEVKTEQSETNALQFNKWLIIRNLFHFLSFRRQNNNDNETSFHHFEPTRTSLSHCQTDDI